MRIVRGFGNTNKISFNKAVSVLMCLMLILTMFSGISSAQPIAGSATDTNGKLVVWVLSDGAWQEAGSLSFGKYVQKQVLDLGSYVDQEGTVQVRLQQEGGGAAHLDSVMLGGTPPVAVNNGQGQELNKISQQDNDLINIDPAGTELTFTSGVQSGMLAVTARIEGTVISNIPFQFPLENLYRNIDENSKFYSYKLGSQHSSPAAGSFAGVVAGRTPFFKEYIVPGSGHPAGYAYGWVMNDDKNLYVAQEFTPDNTMDGDKDYAKVYVKTGSGIREFKVSEPETGWGKPYFIYTDKVGYQHKFYEFIIPLKEIGLSDNPVNQEISLAFAGYGTMSVPQEAKMNPAVAYNSSGNYYLSVYEHHYFNYWYEYNQTHIGAQLINAQGEPIGDTLDLCQSEVNHRSNPAVTYNPTADQFLVVWEDYRSDLYEVYGQLVNGDGTLSGENFLISSEGSYDTVYPSVVFDNVSGRFVVAWNGRGNIESVNQEIYGQLVNQDGSLQGDNFTISGGVESKKTRVSLAFNGSNRVLAVWQDTVDGQYDITGQFINSDGGREGDEFAVCQNPESQSEPSVAFDSSNNRFMVIWTDNRNMDTQNEDIYGRLVNPDGSFVDEDFLVAGSGDSEMKPVITYNTTNSGYLAAWSQMDSNTEAQDIFGQFLSEDGTSAGDILHISSADWPGNLGVALNSQHNNFLIASDSNWDDISYNIVSNDEPESTIYFGEEEYTGSENDGSIKLEVYRDEDSEGVASVVYSSAGITATAGADYTEVSGTLTFDEGETLKLIEIPIIDDSEIESEESLSVSLTSPVGSGLGTPKVASIKIRDNDRIIHGGGGGVSQPRVPDGSIIDRVIGNIILSNAVQIDTVKDEITMDYNYAQIKDKPNYSARVYYWNDKARKWVALSSYNVEEGKIRAVNEGYKGWFRVYGVVQPTFTDINGHWSEPVVNRMNGLGMIEGYPEAGNSLIRTAKLNNSVTRSEFAVFLYRLLNINPDEPVLPSITKEKARDIVKAKFKDADEIPDWALIEAATLADAGIVEGRSGDFYGDAPISRIEGAVMVSNAMKKLPGYKKADLSVYKDAADVPDWAKTALADNLLSGYPDGTLRPNQNIERGEALTVFHKLFINGMGW